MKKRIYSTSKEDILEAALRVLSQGGSKSLTTDAVIKESGLSKAGFFYNFKSKSDLVVALAQKLHREWSDEVLDYIKNDPEPHGRTLRANARSVRDHIKNRKPGFNVLNHAISELLFTNADFAKHLGSCPENIPPIGKKEGLSKQQELLIFMALEGLWYQSISPSEPTISHRQQLTLVDSLIEMTKKPIKKSRTKRTKS